MARKGVLVSNPDIQNMTRTGWMFEYYSLKNMEKSIYETYFKILKKLLISTLGLNIIKPLDANGMPKNSADMTEAEREDFVPLTAWVGHSELLQEVKKQYDSLVDDTIPTASEEYERLAAAIDAADGDIEPILGLENISLDISKDELDKIKLGNIKVEQVDPKDIK